MNNLHEALSELGWNDWFEQRLDCKSTDTVARIARCRPRSPQTLESFNESNRIMRTILIAFLATSMSACATKPVEIITLPHGAEVSNGYSTCTSPCVLQINNKVKYLKATLPDGREKTVALSDELIQKDNVSGNIARNTGETLNLIGGGLLAIGLIYSLSPLEKTPAGEISEYNKKLFLFCATAWAGSYGFITAGNKMKKLDKVKDQIEIDFGEY